MTVSLVKDDNKIVLTNSLPNFFKQFIVKQHKFKCAWTKKNGDFRVGNLDLRLPKSPAKLKPKLKSRLSTAAMK